MEIEVKGHSGCSIDIVRESGQLYVLKQTNDRKYAERLYKQAMKQEAASTKEYQFIRIPKIKELVKDDSGFQINMEYIYSRNFIEHFEAAGFEQINYFIQAIILFIQREITESPLAVVDRYVLIGKFEDIRQKISDNSDFKSDTEIKEILNKSEQVFLNLPEKLNLPVGTCHGDLTLSNILFNGNNYYLIDFLDSFVESPLMDMVKIRQDSAYLWSTLMYDKSYDIPRLGIIAEKIDQQLHECFQSYSWYAEYYDTFQLMNFLRILQYAHEEKVIVYLKNVLKKLI